MRVLAVLLLLACPLGQEAEWPEKETARVAAWAEPLGERLTALLPDPADALDGFAPWDYEFLEPPVWGCPLGCTVYAQLAVSRPYVVRDPGLVANVEATERSAAEMAEKIIAKPADETLFAQMKRLEQRVETLKRSVRRILLEIRVNEAVQVRRGAEGQPAKIGVIAGYPAYRFTFLDESYEPTPAGVRLAVILGRETFAKQKATRGVDVKTEVQTVVVSAALTSDREHVKSDEALARALLERVDYGELVKLLK